MKWSQCVNAQVAATQGQGRSGLEGRENRAQNSCCAHRPGGWPCTRRAACTCPCLSGCHLAPRGLVEGPGVPQVPRPDSSPGPTLEHLELEHNAWEPCGCTPHAPALGEAGGRVPSCVTETVPPMSP